MLIYSQSHFSNVSWHWHSQASGRPDQREVELGAVLFGTIEVCSYIYIVLLLLDIAQ